MNNVFKINGLGSFKYLFSLVDFDYPRTFICKKTNSSSIELYLFDEINHGDDFVEWACVQISVDDVDRLNQGLNTIENCFVGPRQSNKEGYKVISKKGNIDAEAVFLDDVSLLISDNQTYVEPFITDTHGADLYSAIYEKPMLAVIIKPERFADPMVDTTRISNGSNVFKAMINSLPYAIETRKNRMCLSQTHSLVMYFEISDKQLVDKNQIRLFPESDENIETHSALSAIKAILDKESSSETIINAFKGDKESINKTSRFFTEIKKNNSDKSVSIKVADNSTINNSFEKEIDEETLSIAKDKVGKVVQIIDKQDNHEISTFKITGYFLMLDTTGRKKFKFKSNDISDGGAIYSGFADAKINGLIVDSSGAKRYKVVIQSDILRGSFGRSKPIYTLLNIIEEESNPEQIKIFE